MMLPRVIPTLLLSKGGLVKTVRFKNGVYIGDPINTVRLFNDMEVDELVLLDIDASRRGSGPDLDLIRSFSSECFMPFGYGGGVTTLDQMHALFTLGVEKVILNQAVLTDSSLIEQAAARFGSQSVVAAVDVKKDLFGRPRVYDHLRRKVTKLTVEDHIRRLENAGAGEIILYDVDRDGVMEGYNLEMIRHIADNLGVPLVASGGAGCLENLSEAIAAGASAVAAGSIFVYQSRKRGILINYPSRSELVRLFS